MIANDRRVIISQGPEFRQHQIMTEMFGAIFAVVGLALGLGLSYWIRRYRAGSEATRKARTPVIYASRQQARKAERERRKR